MSESDEKDGNKPRSGRVRHDPGGRAIWEWAVDSGRQAVDSTSRLLKKLELTGLTLMGEDTKPWEKKLPEGSPDPRTTRPGTTGSTPELLPEPDPLANKGKGFNPYDTRTPVGRGAPVPKKPAPGKPVASRVTQPPARKRGLFARLFGRR